MTLVPTRTPLLIAAIATIITLGAVQQTSASAHVAAPIGPSLHDSNAQIVDVQFKVKRHGVRSKGFKRHRLHRGHRSLRHHRSLRQRDHVRHRSYHGHKRPRIIIKKRY